MLQAVGESDVVFACGIEMAPTRHEAALLLAANACSTGALEVRQG